MTRPVDLILPDAGPIISLAHADRLDLLELFDRPVIVLDVVKFECLRKPDSPDHDRLQSWFRRSGNRIIVAATPLGPLYLEAQRAERAGTDRSATRGLGDATLSWALQNVERIARPGSVPLMLVEDRKLAVSLEGLNRGHILSTRAWLAALEEAGAIDDYEAIIDEMAQHGRRLSNLAVDAPADQGGEPSSWLPALKPAKSKP